MKKVVIVLALLGGAFITKAQDERRKRDEEKGGFKKENLFTGGGAIVSLASYNTVLGASRFWDTALTGGSMPALCLILPMDHQEMCTMTHIQVTIS